MTSTGKYPGVAGFDVGHLEVYYTAQRDLEFARLIKGKDRTGGDFEPGMNIDNISFDFMRKAIRFAYLYSLREDFRRFAEDEGTYFVSPPNRA